MPCRSLIEIEASERHCPDGLTVARRRRGFQTMWLTMRIEHPGLVDFGEIVIFGGEPENWNGRGAGSS